MLNTGLQTTLEAYTAQQAADSGWQDVLSALAADLRDANNRLYGEALAAGLVVPVRHNASHPVASSSARVSYDTARDLALDAVRITVVGLVVQFGLVEASPLVVLALMVLLAGLLRLVIAHVGEA